jgi:hypothetical protein
MKKSQKKVNREKRKNKLIWIILAVLLVVIIVLGIYLANKIFCCGVKGDLTNQQLRSELNKSLSGNIKAAIYPSTKLVEVTQEGNGWVGLGIKNVGTAANNFSYSVSLSKVSACSIGVSKATAESWITTGRTGDNINIPSGDFSVQKVLLTIPTGTPLCIIRYGVNVKADGTPYTTNFFDVSIKAK